MTTVRLLSKHIITARKQKQLKQDGLGQVLGCTRSYISKLESGLILPSVTFARLLEKALKLKKGTLVHIVATIKVREAALKKQAVQKARGLDGDGRNGYRLNGDRLDGRQKNGYRLDGHLKDGRRASRKT